MRLHHVQVGMPAGGEDEARRFYRDGLGLAEVDKPAGLAQRGGAWFRSAGGAEIHLGVEADPRPPERAHPALAVDSTAELESLGARLEDLGFEVDWSQRYNALTETGGFERFHAHDPFGNRVEVVREVTDQ
ncbi:VOC family protein [Nocardioides sp. CER19]|uniref:VOC family protein n=1 Tax=Nocardioides sp. CER19 TaxID=3038538 RepID=UPI00244787BC|nr:VOC family protein [Nocardioides sp. CER19]MDH2414696.1 VOC family protein [Nocardioides sp. CER19]